MIKLNLGCGDDIKKGYINVDLFSPEAELKWDLNKLPYPFKTNSVDEIMMIHVLEHVNDPCAVVEELIRISKPDAKIIIEVPHYNHSASIEAVHKTLFTRHWFRFWYKNNARPYYTRPNGYLEEDGIIVKPTWIGYPLLFDKLRIVFTHVLNIPFIFSLTFNFKVRK
jgi:SAM-dependent methyltransferase